MAELHLGLTPPSARLCLAFWLSKRTNPDARFLQGVEASFGVCFSSSKAYLFNALVCWTSGRWNESDGLRTTLAEMDLDLYRNKAWGDEWAHVDPLKVV